MPYQKLEELPEAVKGIPKHAQEIWMAAFNSAFEQYGGDEEKCMATAWAAVKNKYKKEGDEWVALETNSMIALTIAKEIPVGVSEFQLLPDGKIEIEGEPPAILDGEGAQSILGHFDRRGNDIVIDYEHQTLKDTIAPAAGWIKKLVYKGKDGLWAIVEWTEKAKEYIKNKEYRYFSPVFWISAAERKILKIENVALTNYPKINNLRPILAKMDLENSKPKTKEVTMLEKLKRMLGLAVDAAEEKVEEAVTLLVNKVKSLEAVVACKEVLEAIGAKAEATKEEVIQIVASLKAPADVAKTLSLEVASLRKELNEIKLNDLVVLALKEGKTSPEELDKWGRDLALKNPEQFKLIVLSRPAGSVIPLDRIQLPPPNRDGGTDETQLLINKMLGITDDTWKKYNQKS